ncbi:hypothetical protein DDY07_08660 [Methylomonas sp. ZR1]|nr:hypothetical protein [Methylomonas sp. ZR1]
MLRRFYDRASRVVILYSKLYAIHKFIYKSIIYKITPPAKSSVLRFSGASKNKIRSNLVHKILIKLAYWRFGRFAKGLVLNNILTSKDVIFPFAG